MTILKVKSFKNYKSISIRIEMNKWNQWDLNPSIKWDQLIYTPNIIIYKYNLLLINPKKNMNEKHKL